MGLMKYQTPEFRDAAVPNTILCTQVGSGLHGVAIEGTDDRDEMGICIEPPNFVLGLDEFSQYEFRTQPEHHRSGPGDLDLIIYSLRKWMKLAIAGNATAILPLFAPESEIVTIDESGEFLREHKFDIVTRQCAPKFLGYLNNQRMRMLGLKSKHTNRPELIEKYGYDTKFAYHAVRIGMQGHELISMGRLTLPMQDGERQILLDIRHGEYSQEAVVEMIDNYERMIHQALPTSPLIERPSMKRINRMLTMMYARKWGWEWDFARGL